MEVATQKMGRTVIPDNKGHNIDNLQLNIEK
jgi:hypothetical protein